MSDTTNTVTVHEAWSAVMADVRELGKNQTNSHQKFNFRGVDDVMNAAGPALRKHGVSVIPERVHLTNAAAATTSGKAAREATVVVEYRIYGPAGDSMPGASAGESLDSGDKATPKAMSVAFRTFLLQALCLPTHDTDPDAQSYERAPDPSPEELTAQLLAGVADSTTEAEVREWGNRAHAKGLLTPELTELVTARLTELQVAS